MGGDGGEAPRETRRMLNQTCVQQLVCHCMRAVVEVVDTFAAATRGVAELRLLCFVERLHDAAAPC